MNLTPDNHRNQISLTIDERRITAHNGQTILEAALAGGIYIPHLCHHPDLRSVGSCGLCLVAIEGIDGLPRSCMTEAADGMVVTTKNPTIDRLRTLGLELLLADHPAECLACSQYLNCELQSVKQYLGITEELRLRRRLKPIPIQLTNPLIVHDFSRCIRCGRCVRACNELRGVGVLDFFGQGQDIKVGTTDDRSLAESGCRFCGACVEVCPTGAIRDQEELVKGKKRREALIPCRYSCPAEIDVPRYVRLIKEQNYSEATAVVREKVPFPKVLGYVCNHPCEQNCRRGEINQPIAIRELKRFAAENDTLRLWGGNPNLKTATGRRVAVIGSGPAGLTAAACLAKAGHEVTVFEALPEAGGMLRYGIPAYRLPRHILDEEIAEIVKLGVTITTDTRIEELENLTLEHDFDAVLVAIGAQAGIRLPIPGNSLPGVWDGLTFLREVNLGHSVAVGRQILVLGGGNVAFDCARVARRLGAVEVSIACLENREAMPAAGDEIEEGEEEGITVFPLRTFTGIIAAEGRTTGVACRMVKSFAFDEDGRLALEVDENSDHVIAADMVIFAIGQRPQIPEDFELDLDPRGRIEIDPYSLDTGAEGIFAAGDAVTGTTSVIQAIAAGRQSAGAIDRYLDGDGNFEETLASPERPAKAWLGPDAEFPRADRCGKTCIGMEERVSGFCPLVESITADTATRESSRCLQCDLRMKITPVKFWGSY